jgi:glycosyltransferase involved in cell wall biosynthesis
MNDKYQKRHIIYSIIVLLEEPHQDFVMHIRILNRIFQQRGESFELLIVTNGLESFLRPLMPEIGRYVPAVSAIVLNKKAPQSVCLQVGFKASQGDVIVACGSYQQITENSFGRLLDALKPGVDIVIPWRCERVDPPINQLQSRIFNAILVVITKSPLHDLSCTPRILRREVLEAVPIYGNLYRFLPILAQQRGYRVREVPCAHYQELGKTGLYSFSEYMGRLIDIGTLYFNTRFSRKPLRFFSTIGAGLVTTGGLITLWVFVRKILFDVSIGNSVELLTAIILMVAGIGMAGLGLLGEIIAFTYGRQRKEYTIEKII